MCGIFGVINKKNVEINLNQFKSSVNMLKHRGPDNSGFINYKNTSFGHTRLSIISLSETSNQPYITQKNNILTFNGEIYNFRDLINKFKIPQNIHLNSDTLVLGYLLDNYELNFVLNELRGMYAFAYLNKNSNELFLTRDIFGEKPLYYELNNDFFSFSSEIASLTNYSKNDRISNDGLNEYFKSGYIKFNSIYNNIYSVNPSEYITININDFKLTKTNYYKPQIKYENNMSFESIFVDSIKRVTTSDVPIGSLLSGGIDSTLVAYGIKKFTNIDLMTFTVGFDDKKLDESYNAEQTSKFLNTKHFTIYQNINDSLDYVINIPIINDQPFADYSMIPTLMIYNEVSKYCKVIISGDGGDELFGGYRRYIDYNKIWKNRFLLNLPFAKSIIKFAFDNRIADRIYNSLKNNDFTLFYISMNSLDQSIEYNKNKFQLNNLLRFMMSHDIENYLPYDILYKVDKSSMFNSIESRTPFLDRDLYEFSLGLKNDELISSAYGSKSILKEYLSKNVPKSIWNRPKKGFGPPLGNWFKNELKSWAETNLFKNHNEYTDLYYSEKKVKDLWNKHLNGIGNYQHELWSIISFNYWYINQKK